MDGSHGGRRPVSAPVIEAEARGFRAPGTTFMVSGALIGAIGAYLFQVYGGRALGPEAFAPIAVLWTSFFILATVLLIPLEQYVTREVASGRKAIPHDFVPAAAMAGIGALAGAAFVWSQLDELFEGSWSYIAQIALLMVGYSLLLMGKGVFVGSRHYSGAGWILIIESVARLVAGVVAIQLFATAESLGWAMVLGGFAALGTRWWRRDVGDPRGRAAPASRFLGGYVGGSASSQVLLAIAPIVVATLGAGPALVSIVFVTFTLFRAPMTLILALQGRLLPFLVGLVGAGDYHQLARIARRVLGGGAVVAVLGGMVGWLIGPEVVTLLFGEEFAPTSVVAMFAAAGVMAAAAAQITGQVLVAEGRTARLSLAWFGGLVAGVIALLVLGGEPDTRVAVSFAIGEGVALMLMGALAIRR